MSNIKRDKKGNIKYKEDEYRPFSGARWTDVAGASSDAGPITKEDIKKNPWLKDFMKK